MAGMSAITTEWIPISEAAEKAGVDHKTIHNWIKANRLRWQKINARFFVVFREDVDRESREIPHVGRPRGKG